MNITHHLDTLLLVQQIGTILQIHAGTGTVAARLPVSASFTQYGPDGQAVASQANVSYASLGLDENGKINGGSLQHQENTSDGKPLGSSELHFSAQGLPVSCRTSIHNRFADGVFKTIDADFSSTQWTAAGTIHGGPVTLRICHADASGCVTQGSMQFSKEILSTATLTHFLPDGSGKISGATEIDYSNAKWVANRFVGGYAVLQSKSALNNLKSSANLFFSSLGQALQIHTTNYDVNSGQATSQIATDFSGAQFNPRNELESGSVSHQVTDMQGSPLSNSTAEFAAGLPQKITTGVYKSGALHSNIVTTYEGAQFNNDLQVINSKRTLDTCDPTGARLAQTIVAHDGRGNVVSKATDVYHPRTGALIAQVQADYGNAVFNHKNKAISGNISIKTSNLLTQETTTVLRTLAPLQDAPAPAQSVAASAAVQACASQRTVLTDAGGNIASVKEQTLRGDGSLLKSVMTRFQQGKAVSCTMTLYAPDGNTVCMSHQLDFGQAEFDTATQVLHGTVSFKSLFRGVSLSSSGVIQY